MKRVIRIQCFGTSEGAMPFVTGPIHPGMSHSQIHFVRNGIVNPEKLTGLPAFLARHLDHIYPFLPAECGMVLLLKQDAFAPPVDFMPRFQPWDRGSLKDYLEAQAEAMLKFQPRAVRLLKGSLDTTLVLDPSQPEPWRDYSWSYRTNAAGIAYDIWIWRRAGERLALLAQDITGCFYEVLLEPNQALEHRVPSLQMLCDVVFSSKLTVGELVQHWLQQVATSIQRAEVQP